MIRVATTREGLLPILSAYDNFDECCLLDITSHHFGSSIHLRLQRPPRWNQTIVVLRAELVFEFILTNRYGIDLLREPERMDWGFTELAVIRPVERADGGPLPDRLEFEGLMQRPQDRRFYASCGRVEAEDVSGETASTESPW